MREWRTSQEFTGLPCETIQTATGSQFSGQLLSVSSVKEGEVDQSKLFFVNKADAQWVQLQRHKPGWVAVLPKLRSFIAPRGGF